MCTSKKCASDRVEVDVGTRHISRGKAQGSRDHLQNLMARPLPHPGQTDNDGPPPSPQKRTPGYVLGWSSGIPIDLRSAFVKDTHNVSQLDVEFRQHDTVVNSKNSSTNVGWGIWSWNACTRVKPYCLRQTAQE